MYLNILITKAWFWEKMAEKSTEEYRTCNFLYISGYVLTTPPTNVFRIHLVFTEASIVVGFKLPDERGGKMTEPSASGLSVKKWLFRATTKNKDPLPCVFYQAHNKCCLPSAAPQLDQGNKQFRRLKLKFSLRTNLEKGSVNNIQNLRFHLQYLPQKCLSLISWTTGSSSMQTQVQSQSHRTLERIDHCHQWLCTIQNPFLQQLCRPGSSFSFHSVYQ